MLGKFDRDRVEIATMTPERGQMIIYNITLNMNQNAQHITYANHINLYT